VCYICRVGQNRIYTPHMTAYLVISQPKIPYTHRMYMVLANPIYMHMEQGIAPEGANGANVLKCDFLMQIMFELYN